jgi:hypothetical protein
VTHERLNMRDRTRRVGTENIAGRGLPSGVVIASSQPTAPQPTKADMRQQADAAWRTWSATRVSS